MEEDCGLLPSAPLRRGALEDRRHRCLQGSGIKADTARLRHGPKRCDERMRAHRQRGRVDALLAGLRFFRGRKCFSTRFQAGIRIRLV